MEMAHLGKALAGDHFVASHPGEALSLMSLGAQASVYMPSAVPESSVAANSTEISV